MRRTSGVWLTLSSCATAVRARAAAIGRSRLLAFNVRQAEPPWRTWRIERGAAAAGDAERYPLYVRALAVLAVALFAGSISASGQSYGFKTLAGEIKAAADQPPPRGSSTQRSQVASVALGQDVRVDPCSQSRRGGKLRLHAAAHRAYEYVERVDLRFNRRDGHIHLAKLPIHPVRVFKKSGLGSHEHTPFVAEVVQYAGESLSPFLQTLNVAL